METSDNISCPEVQSLLESFCRDLTEPERSLLVRRHLGLCENCRQTFLKLAASEFFAAKDKMTDACRDAVVMCHRASVGPTSETTLD